MNSEIDITQFGVGSSSRPADSGQKLVAPPRRLFTRYLLPVLLLAGFGGVTAYAFRGAFVPTIDVFVTMPVPASQKLIEKADGLSVDADHAAAEMAVGSGDQSDSAHAAMAGMDNSDDSGGRPVPGRGKALFQAPGWIEPSPYPIVIPSLRAGTIQSLEVIEGQTVSSGSVVARLVDEDDLLAVKMHESTLRLKQAKYDAALSRWKNPTDLVEAVSTARAKGSQLDAQARRLRDQAELAGLEARIGSTLTRSGYEPSLETARKNTELSASKNQIQETYAEIALNSATLEAASERMRLRIEDREAVETAQAELLEARAALDQTRLQLSRSVITAPTSGTIMRLAVSPGSMLSGEMVDGLTVAQMYKPDMLQVRVDVPLAEAAKVRPGLPAEIRVEALPDRRFRGELVNIVPQFDLQKNILPVKVRIFNPDQALRPEMIARVEFFAEQVIAPSKPAPAASAQTASAKETTGSAAASGAGTVSEASVLMFPAAAVRTAGNTKHIMVVGQDNTVIDKPLREVAVVDGMALVREGLRITDKIITSPAGVTAGRAVKIKGIEDHGTH